MVFEKPDFPPLARRSIWIPLVALAASFLTPGLVRAHQDEMCQRAQGRLFNSLREPGPGRMIGTVAGDYWIETRDRTHDADGTSVVFTQATSRVETGRGILYFREYGALDGAEETGTNGVVLVLVSGGTGEWQGTSGHIAFFGFLHSERGVGEWYYEGELCDQGT